MVETDAAAIERAKAGDGDSFRILVERYSRSVFRLAYRITGNESDAEDVVQETFLRAYRQLALYESRCSFSTWIYRIASNYSLDLIRSRKRRENRQMDEDVSGELKAPEPGQDRMYYSTQVRQKLDSALAGLSDQERTAFLLRHCEGQSIEEIGSTLSLGTSATKQSIFRAVRKLREALEPMVNTI